MHALSFIECALYFQSKYTIKRHNSRVHYDMVLHTSLQELRQSFMDILKKIDYVRRKDSNKKEYEKSNFENQILNKKSRDSNFLVIYSTNKT